MPRLSVVSQNGRDCRSHGRLPSGLVLRHVDNDVGVDRPLPPAARARHQMTHQAQRRTTMNPTPLRIRSSQRSALVAAASAALVVLTVGVSRAEAQVIPPLVPQNIEVDYGNTAFLIGHATGTQNYICVVTNGGFAWTFFGPQATLFGDDDQQLTTHFLSSNPRWPSQAPPIRPSSRPAPFPGFCCGWLDRSQDGPAEPRCRQRPTCTACTRVEALRHQLTRARTPRISERKPWCRTRPTTCSIATEGGSRGGGFTFQIDVAVDLQGPSGGPDRLRQTGRTPAYANRRATIGTTARRM